MAGRRERELLAVFGLDAAATVEHLRSAAHAGVLSVDVVAPGARDGNGDQTQTRRSPRVGIPAAVKREIAGGPSGRP